MFERRDGSRDEVSEEAQEGSARRPRISCHAGPGGAKRKSKNSLKQYISMAWDDHRALQPTRSIEEFLAERKEDLHEASLASDETRGRWEGERIGPFFA